MSANSQFSELIDRDARFVRPCCRLDPSHDPGLFPIPSRRCPGVRSGERFAVKQCLKKGLQ